jgi:hypothetical protein
MASIIKTAKELAPPTTLVMGSSGSGKSSLVRDEILKADWKALWVAFNNTAALVNPATDSAATWGKDVAEWAVAVVDSWSDFNTEILVPGAKGEFSQYNTLVLDGVNVAAALALANVVKGKSVTTQADWGDASELVRDAVVRLRSQFERVFLTVDVVATDTGAKKINLNPYAAQLIVTLCGERWYTYVKTTKDAKGQVTGITYDVQRNSVLALNFTPNPEK